MKIELFQPGQEERISEIFWANMRIEVPDVYTPEQAEISRYWFCPETVRDDCLNNNVITLVAIDDGRIIGTGSADRRYGNGIKLTRLYVDPECHGIGAGTLLMNALENGALSEGHETAWGNVISRSKALGFYEKRGYEQVGFVRYSIPLPGERGYVKMDFIRISKKLRLYLPSHSL